MMYSKDSDFHGYLSLVLVPLSYIIIYNSLHYRAQVDVIYTDFFSFDFWSFSSLLYFLEFFGFGEPLLPWFRSYLSMRKYWVNIYGVKSIIRNVLSEVPQKGHLSHLVFLLFLSSFQPLVFYLIISLSKMILIHYFLGLIDLTYP